MKNLLLASILKNVWSVNFFFGSLTQSYITFASYFQVALYMYSGKLMRFYPLGRTSVCFGRCCIAAPCTFTRSQEVQFPNTKALFFARRAYFIELYFAEVITKANLVVKNLFIYSVYAADADGAGSGACALVSVHGDDVYPGVLRVGIRFLLCGFRRFLLSFSSFFVCPRCVLRCLFPSAPSRQLVRRLFLSVCSLTKRKKKVFCVVKIYYLLK